MCGIIGRAGRRPCEEILLAGLQRLEYRVAMTPGRCFSAGWPHRVGSCRWEPGLAGRCTGDACRRANWPNRRHGDRALSEPTTGIGRYRRWATHGTAHSGERAPHSDTDGRVHIVLNGIIENHLALREELLGLLGTEFRSETDAEVVAHLIAHHYQGDLVAGCATDGGAPRRPLCLCRDVRRASGSACRHAPRVPAGARCGRGGVLIASAIPAFLRHTRRVQVLGEGEIAVLRPGRASLLDASGGPVPMTPVEVDWDDDTAEKEVALRRSC